MSISASNDEPKMKVKIMKQYKVILVALLGIVLTACYNKFEMPEPTVVYNDESFEVANPDLEHISIAELKSLFGEVSGTGDTGSQNDTKYIHFVPNTNECTQFELDKGWYNTDNYYIKGKVISNDEQGNIYKSLYIFDGTEAIELKLTNGLFLDYPCNLDSKESMWVYVKIRGLYLGNYRMMLSLGDIPTSSFNSWGDYKYYPNSNILSQNKVRQHIFVGEKTTLSEGESDTDDILVVDNTSHTKLFGEEGRKYLGRLIRFKGLKVLYAGTNNGKEDTPKVGSNIYPQWICSSGIPSTIGGPLEQIVNKPWYKMAYSVNGIAQYGSILVTYADKKPSSTNKAGVYTVRTSGYSRFADNFIPKDGAVGDLLAIYSLYSKEWNYSYATYQLTLNRFEDFEFETEPKEPYPSWSAHIASTESSFPAYSLRPLTDDAVHSVDVAIWKAQYEANKPTDDGSELWIKWNEWGDWVVWCLENTPKESWLLPQYLTEEDDIE